jgi:quercetin dioxygenase-like cupin family protein
MRMRTTCATIVAIGVSALAPIPAVAQLMSACVEKAPVPDGQLGCSILQTKLLPRELRAPVFWHIDRFDGEAAARAGVGDAGVAFQDGGTWWLMTIESETSNHRGGRHVARVGPLPLPPAPRYSMLIQSAVFGPGMYSLPHHHSGVEAVYVLEGEACYETPTSAAKLRKGETVVMPAGTPMRAVVTGSARRHVLAVIVHDSARPATMRMEEGTGPKLAACT